MAFSLFASSKKDDRRKELSPDILASVRVMADDIIGVPLSAPALSGTKPLQEADPNIMFDIPSKESPRDTQSPFLSDTAAPSSPGVSLPPFEAEQVGALPPADIPLLEDTEGADTSSASPGTSDKGTSLNDLLQQTPDKKTPEPIMESPSFSREEVFSEAPESTVYIDAAETSPFSSKGVPNPNVPSARPQMRIPMKALGFGMAVVGVVLLIGGGIYLFMAETKDGSLSSVDTLPQGTPALTPFQTPPLSSPAIAPYASDKPNYLSVDTETITLSEAAKLFSEVAEKMRNAKMTQPVEFVMTDKNNNPIAFSRLAYLLKFELSADFLKQLDESFSIFVILDGEDVRLGLALSAKDAAAFAQRVAKEEGLFPYALRSLYALSGETITPLRRMTFKSGNHNGQTIRYVNIDVAQNVSLDYVLREKQWIIGTSKNSLRTLLDRVR